MNASDANAKTGRVPKKKDPAQKQKPKPKQKLPNASCLGQGVSFAASQRAAAILEVLAGERTPRQAAAVLSMSLPNFYIVERKALQGLLKACEPQPKGPPAPGPERKVEVLELQLARCKRECQRQEALVRATQRTVGLPVSPSPPTGKEKTGEKNGVRRRRRRPVVRALRAARTLRQNSSGSAPPAELKTLATEEGTLLPTTCEKETEHVAACG
jgi:hypothetical protein